MPARPHTVHLALGTNLGDRAENLRRAVAALADRFALTALSPVYETDPRYRLDQPRFYNQCAVARTALSCQDALAHLKRIEGALGRVPGERYGPRLIDLDLLFYDDLVHDGADLTLPHPLLHERAFVLVPLADVAGEVVHPTLGLTVRELRDRLPETERGALRPVAEPS